MSTRIPQIDPARCSGCGVCIGACVPGVLGFETHVWRKQAVLLQQSPCTGCGLCQVRCWTGAIKMVRHIPCEASAQPRTADV